jgi:hypothetical protein
LGEVVSDIFISYAREDRATAQRLAQALEERGFSVWWDWDLIGGANYRSKIRDVIAEAKKAIVVWSRHSVTSGFVIDEASEARKLGKLIPVSIDRSDPPFGFGDLHTIMLDDPGLDVEAIVAALEDRPMPRSPAVVSRRQFGNLVTGGAVLSFAAAAGGGYWLYTLPPAKKSADAVTLPRLALVIGNSSYTFIGTLANATRDADSVATALEQRGFRVVKEKDLTRDQMIKALTEFETTLSIIGGTGVFYYAGSAVYVDGEDILLPVDARGDVATSSIVNGVNLTQLRGEIRSRTTRTMTDHGVTVIYSASKGQVASDGPPGGNSPFTAAFLQAIANRDDDLSDTFRRIGTAMRAHDPIGDSVNRQTPFIDGTLLSKFYFSRPETDVTAGVMRILVLDSCRDNPFKKKIVTQ